MDQCMMVSGKMIKPAAKAKWSTKMEMSIRVNGKMEQHMDTGFYFIMMACNIVASGLKTKWMGKESLVGPMAINTKAIT